jgi:outer membrane protein assembly factor BamB
MREALQHGWLLQRCSGGGRKSFFSHAVNLALAMGGFWFVLWTMNLPSVRSCLLPLGFSLGFTLAPFQPAAAADEWPQFRGPAGDGTAQAAGLPEAPGEGTEVVWKTAIHGKAWSSPVISGDRIWLTTASEDGTELSLVVVDRQSGRILRDEVVFKVENPQFCHKFNSYASPTPAVAGGKVYLSFGSPGTACFDEVSGAKLWERRDFVCNHFRGAGSSPVVWRDSLLLHFDGSDFQYLVALDRHTGKTLWRTDRTVDFKDLTAEGKPTGDGDFRKAFATPAVVEWEGKSVLLSSGAKCHYAYDPLTGKELWRVEERAQHSASERPLFWRGMAFFQSGFKGQILAVKLGGSGVLEESQLAWRVKKGVPSKPSMLLVEGMLYMVDDSGIASCVDATSGEVVWSERIGGNFSASPIYADGRIYAFNEEGKVTTFAAEKTFRKIGEGQFESGFMASPAVAGNALYLRTKTHLYRLEKRR